MCGLLLPFVCFCFCYLSWVFFACLFYFPFSFFFLFSLVMLRTLQALGSLARGWTWASGVGAPSPGCWTTREFLSPGNINWCELSWRYPSPHQDLAPPNCLQAPVPETSCQTTSKKGTQPHPSADRIPKVILRSQTPQNTPPDVALPIRGKRLSSTHQSTGTSPSHQEAYTSPWTKLTHQGEDNRNNGNYDTAACKKETINTVNSTKRDDREISCR